MSRAMTRTLFALLLVALAAPFALADDVPATETAPAPAVDDQQAAPAEEPSLEELLEQIDPAAGAEDRYLCMFGSCTTAWDCELNQDPPNCSYQRLCDNPTGAACRGTCYCC